MTKTRKDRPDLLIGLGFDEALRRLAQTDPKELRDSIAQALHDEEETREYVEERRESIRKGARRAGKRFRL